MTDAHAHAHAGAEALDHHDEGHDLAHLDSHLRAAYVVFGALLLLTGATVGASYLHLPTKPAIILCLVIATIKGSLVALWFMHLISERKLIHYVLALTVVFFFTLLLIPHWTAEDRPHLQGNPASAQGAAGP